MTDSITYITLKDINDNHVSVSIEEISKSAANGKLLLFGLTISEIAELIDSRLKKPNVVFGVLDNGEIFVEVGGKQYTPASEFYKMASIQSAKLAHQVRDLDFKLDAEKSNNKNIKIQNAEMKSVIGNIRHELTLSENA